MPWSIGAVHNLAGHGETPIGKPVALAIVVSQVNASSNVRVGQPPTYWGLGHLALGTTSGFLEDLKLRHVSQLYLCPAREFTRLGYTLEPGVLITVTELQGDTSPTFRLMPYDRNPTPVVLAAEVSPAAAAGTTTLWTYTVPAGKKLWLAHARVSVRRWTVASAAQYWSARVTSSTLGALVLVYMTGNAIGDEARDALDGPLVLPEGHVISANWVSGDTGGSTFVLAHASGYTFDA